MMPYFNINYKFTPSFWNQFSKQEHYFKGSILLEEQKLSGYLDFLKNINFNEGLLLKTDLYVEAKNKNDNFLPYLKINRCVGMDISFEIVKMARENLRDFFPAMKFVVADIRHLPFKEGSFNAVISDSTLDHSPRNALVNTLIETKRIIKNKGKIIVALNNIFNPLSIYDSSVKNFFTNDYFISFCYRPRYILTLLKNLGFSTMHWDYIISVDSLGALLVKLSRKVKGIDSLARQWLSVVMQLSKLPFLKMFFCLQFIILADKAGEEN